MNVYLKWGLRILLGFIGLFILLIVYVKLFVDPNDFKDDIAAYVKKETGRDLVIKGNLSISVFPWAGIELEKLELGDTKEFRQKTLAVISRLDVKARLWPLIFGKLKTDTLVIRGLRLNLVRGRDGKTNLEQLLAGRKKQGDAKKPDAGKKQPAKKSKPVTFNIRGVEISDAAVHYRDLKTGETWQIDKLNASTSGLGSRGAKDLKVNLQYRKQKKARPVKISYRSKIEYDSVKQTLKLGRIRLSVDDLSVSGSASGHALNTSPVFSGTISTGDFIPRDLASRLGVTLPKTRDPSVWGKARISSAFKLKGGYVTLSKLDIRLDDSRLSGHASVRMSGDIPPFNFNLKVNEIDLDRYSAPASKNSAKKKAAARPAGPAAIPPDLVKKITGKGRFEIAKMKVENVLMTNVVMGLTAGKGRIRLHPIKANLYKGKYSGDISVKQLSRRSVALSMNERLTNVSAAELSKNYIPETLAKHGLVRVTGVLGGKARLRFTGRNAVEWRKNSNGNLSFRIKNGRLKGLSAIYTACSLYEKTRGRPAPAFSDKFERFADLAGDIRIRNGRGNIVTLRMGGALYDMNTKGYFDFRRNYLDINFELVLKSDCKATIRPGEKPKQRTLALICKGSIFGKPPKCGIDIKKMAKKKLEKKLRKKLKDKIPGDLFKKLKF